MNRYTNITPSQYSPMTLQELMMAPAYKRQQHDAMSEAIAETEAELAQVDPLDVHSDLARQEQERLYNDLMAQSERLNAEGFNSRTKGDFLKTYKDYQQTVGPMGTIGKINAAKKIYEAKRAEIMQNASNMNHSPEATKVQLDRAYQEYVNNFDGKNVTNFEGIMPPKYVDLQDDLTKVKNWLGSETTSELAKQGYSIQRDEETGAYIMANQSGNKLTETNVPNLNIALDYLNNRWLKEDGEGYKSAQWNLQDSDNISNAINTGLGLMKKTAIKDNRNMTYKSIGSASSLGLQIPGNLNYESTSAENIKIDQLSMSSKLKDIANGKAKPVGGQGAIKHNSGIGLLNPDAIANNKPEEISTFENRFSGPEELNQYKDIFNKLSEVDDSLKGVEWNSPYAANKVANYLDKYGSITRNNNLITDDFVTTYGDKSIGVSKTDKTKIEEGVKANKDERTYHIDGITYTYDQLPSKYKDKDVFDNLEYAGYLGPKNFMTYQFGKKANRKLFVSPIVFKHTESNGKVEKIFISRSTGEMNTPSFKADMMFNDIFVNTNSLPTLPYTIPNTNQTISYYPDGVPLYGVSSDKKYMINKKLSDGSYSEEGPVALTEEELQNKIYSNFGVMTPNEIKAANKQNK